MLPSTRDKVFINTFEEFIIGTLQGASSPQREGPISFMTGGMTDVNTSHTLKRAPSTAHAKLAKRAYYHHIISQTSKKKHA
jgi:hypothetical protein